MGRQVSHLTRLVDDLLDVSRITRGKVRLRREMVALEDVVVQAVENRRAGRRVARLVADPRRPAHWRVRMPELEAAPRVRIAAYGKSGK